MGGIVCIATTILPAEIEVCLTLKSTTCFNRVSPISILLLNFVRQQTKCCFSVETCKKNMTFVDINEENIQNLLATKGSKETKRQITHSVKIYSQTVLHLKKNISTLI